MVVIATLSPPLLILCMEASMFVQALMSPITSTQSTVSILVALSLTAPTIVLAARIRRNRRLILPPIRSMERPLLLLTSAIEWPLMLVGNGNLERYSSCSIIASITSSAIPSSPSSAADAQHVQIHGGPHNLPSDSSHTRAYFGKGMARLFQNCSRDTATIAERGGKESNVV